MSINLNWIKVNLELSEFQILFSKSYSEGNNLWSKTYCENKENKYTIEIQ